MAKRKKKESPEERAAREEGFRESQRLLQERIAYHRTKIEEERKERREASWLRAWRFDWRNALKLA